MISQDQNQTSLIEQTVNTFDGAIGETTATDGLSLIDQWLNRLDVAGDEDTDDIADTLESLRAEVHTAQQYNRPDNQRIASLLQDLIDQTRKVATSAEASAEQVELSQLIATLENLHRQVARATEQA
ncbi:MULTISPECIES: hypothetical protein [Spirosoma]|uniref:Uncharacterized protein n=1 Tax=Spirosoma liriopis TaxID=2937440 RepID=A0ABT0HL98_9BACT|nr:MULTISPECIES: hypothetical protein [Spirosoma]MCK8492730.1 hypothetical protein [Spirosoma liriopis]UHG92197.1 hypothetical protein LQ777_04645 [Spirosoma oryzicola]